MIQRFVSESMQMVSDMINRVHTAIPAKIVEFDPVLCKAKVLPTGKMKKPDGKTVDYPQIDGVPILLMQSNMQKVSVVYPIKPDDECLLLFSEQQLDQFLYQRVTGTSLRFDLSNAIAIVGLFREPNKNMKKACDEEAFIIHLKGESSEAEVYLSDEKVEIAFDGPTKDNAIVITDEKTTIRGDLHVEGTITSE